MRLFDRDRNVLKTDAVHFRGYVVPLGQDASPADAVAFSIVSAILSAIQQGTGNRSASLSVLSGVQKKLVKNIDDVAGSSFLPALYFRCTALMPTTFNR